MPKMRLIGENEGSSVAVMGHNGDYLFCLHCTTVLFSTWEKMTEKKSFLAFAREAKVEDLHHTLYDDTPEGHRHYWLDERRLIRAIESGTYPDPYSIDPRLWPYLLRRGDRHKNWLRDEQCEKCGRDFVEIELVRDLPKRRMAHLSGGYGTFIGVWGERTEYCRDCFPTLVAAWEKTTGDKILPEATTFHAFSKKAPIDLLRKTIFGEDDQRYWDYEKMVVTNLANGVADPDGGPVLLLLREGYSIREQALIEDGVCGCCGGFLVSLERDYP